MFVINYGIIVVRTGTIDPKIADVLHFVGYEEPPCEADLQEVHEELETDEELGFVGEDVELVVASPDIVEYFRGEVGPID